MRVLHLIGSLDPGGAETLVAQIAARERAAGHDHRIAHLGNAWLAAEAERRGIPQETLPSRALYRSNLTLPLFVLGLARRIDRIKPDVVHAHLFGMTVAGAWAARRARVPCVATIHDRYYLVEKRRRGWMLARTGLDGRLIAVSEDVARTIRDTSGLGARVIPNGVDVAAIRPDPAIRRVVRAELGAKDDEPILITVGRLERVKRHDILLEALARLRANGDPAKLWIVGDGSEREATAAAARALGLGDAARLLGHRDDTPRLLAAADLFVLSSDSEGMPVSLLEAMAAGLPAVARAVGGVPEVVVDGETGLLIDSADPAVLAGRFADALVPARRSAFGEAARRRAETHFSIEEMLAKHRALYAAVVNTSGPRE